MTPQFLQSEATVCLLSQVLLHFLWQGALLGMFAACLLQVLPIHSASARYAYHCGLLALLAVCPLVTWRSVSVRPVAAIDLRADLSGAAGWSDSVAHGGDFATDSHLVRPREARSIMQRRGARAHFDAAWLGRQSGLIVTAWLIGVCTMTTRLLLGALGLWTLARCCQPMPPGVACVVDRLSRQLTFRVSPAVHVVERISQAMAVGILKPMVLLPGSWISELPSDVLEAVIAHELAHLRRWDLLINLLQRVVEAVLFFHPAVWWCSRRLRFEREKCCDELAQRALGNRMIYAKALAYLAHQQCSAVESLLATGIGDQKMVLLERIRNVLGMTPARQKKLYGPSCALVGAVLATLAWVAAFGLPAQWQGRISRMDKKEIAAAIERSSSSKSTNNQVIDGAIQQNISRDEVTEASKSLTLAGLSSSTCWDLSLEEAIETSRVNSKVARLMVESQASQAVPTGEAQEPEASNSWELARINDDISQAELEIGIRNLVSETDNAYWELSFAWRNLQAANTALDSARQVWRKVHEQTLARGGSGESLEESQTREQYFQFKSNAQTLLNELYRAEKRLRYVMGLAASDDRLIMPIDQPHLAKLEFDWNAVTQEALERAPELRRRRWQVKRRELELIAAQSLLQPQLRELPDQKSEAPDDNPLVLMGHSAAETLASGQFQEWALDSPVTLALGSRKELSQVRHYQLQLAKERSKLHDEELEVTRQLAEALRQLEHYYQLLQASFNQMLTADQQVEAALAAYDAQTVTLDQLLEAQRRRADAHTGYFRTLIDYQRAIVAVNFRKGSLL